MATLTKSRYLYGLQCLKRLWIDEHARERLAPASPGEHMIMEQGIEVGKKAREYFRGGILVDIQDFDSADRQTQQLIQDGAACIFEAAFILDDLRVRCDVIQKHTDNTWKIVEVKSSLKVKEEHLPDLAFQHHVLSKLGVPVAGLEILHINSECIYPDLSDLFRSEDVTSQVVALQEKTARDVDIFINTLNRDAEPEVLIGRHCIKPDVCPAKEPCWEGSRYNRSSPSRTSARIKPTNW
jgi:predicted RecB family nuclease